MYLKTLTLKGFKSFASATTMEFEPGVTAVVGPNGSGKSNVVDALAWVMGEQGAKALRGGKMEDVIFAGTAGRPPLGRAEVSLTIDNSDGALPIDYTEVTISRIMFRGGGSEYAINGSPCRLLDVQDLLSDSGIGREMHVIVGQGQLDAILHATAEDRRGFIEEAAGVLKHRKRKEKALRKLDGLEEKLNRLQDLSGELRRQLKPLGRQAEVARRATEIQAEARDARLRLLADEYLEATAALQRDVADEEALLHKRAEVEAELLALRSQEAALQAEQEAAGPELVAAEDLWQRLTRTSERLRGIAAVAAERRSVLAAAAPPAGGREPAAMRAEADTLQEQHDQLAAQAAEHASAIAATAAARAALEDELAAARREAEQARRAVASARDRHGSATRRLSAAQAAVEARRAELQRAATAQESARKALAEVEAERVATDTAQQDEDLSPLQADADRARAALREAAGIVAERRRSLEQAQREQSASQARAETLSQALAGLDANSGSAMLVRDGDNVLGYVADMVDLPEPLRPPVMAVLGALAEGIAVADARSAAAALRLLRERGADRAELAVAGLAATTAAQPPHGELLQSRLPERAAHLLAGLLRDVVLVDDLAAAVALVEAADHWVAVTPAGDVLARHWARGGAREGASRWDARDAVEASLRQAAAARERAESARAALEQALRSEQGLAAEVEQAVSRWQEARTVSAAANERHTQLQRRLRAAEQGLNTAVGRMAALSEALARDERAVREAEQAAAEAAAVLAANPEPEPADNAETLARLGALQQAETDAKLAQRTLQERMASLSQRVSGLRRAAAEEERQRARAEAEQRSRLRRSQIAEQVLALAEAAEARAAADLQQVSQRREQLRDDQTSRSARMAQLRVAGTELEQQVSRLTDSVHRDEIARAEQRLRIEQLEQRALSEFGIDPQVLVAEYGPDVPVPNGDAEPVAYDRQAQERRLRAAERSLALLGTVNPLAMEEFAAAEERFNYLNEQIDDLRRTKRDLLGIVRDVDARVQEVFAEAYADTAAAFERVFARLFPGGEGRLVLTDPDDMLGTGVEVEARPPGKKIKRLSLLSGGERSLTAVAFLVALFKARPSPFYVLDEVEAALDDTNLGRLIEVIEELRETSQIIVITHQKRTMTAADALYGVSMRSDGVTAVVSQRLAEVAPRPVVDLTEAGSAAGGVAGVGSEQVL